MRNLKDKVIAITGGATGIGFALAKALGSEGAKIVIGEPRKDRLKEAVSLLIDLGIEASETYLDVTDLKSSLVLDFEIRNERLSTNRRIPRVWQTPAAQQMSEECL